MSGGSAVSGGGKIAVNPERAGRLLSRLVEGSPEIRAAAVIDAAGKPVVASDDREWGSGCATLWRAADATAETPAVAVHVATGDGEVFSVRDDRAIAVATSERFALASLVLSDLRALLRELHPPSGS